jgi:uncharacterized protein DUF6968
MWKPTKIGQVIAQRRFRCDGPGGRRTVVVRFGRPVRAPRAVARDPWWCPVEVDGLGASAVRAVAGEDSLQALILALEFATNELPLQAGDAGGRLEWLGERERLVFADTRARGLLGRGLQNMAEGLIEALGVLESGGARKSSANGLASELAALVASGGQTRDSKAKQRPPNEALQPTSRSARSVKSKRRTGATRG